MGKIQYPIQVNKINFGKREPVCEGWRCKTGTVVRVRPCGEKYQDKTYLGIYLGDIALSQIARYNEQTQELAVDSEQCTHH